MSHRIAINDLMDRETLAHLLRYSNRLVELAERVAASIAQPV